MRGLVPEMNRPVLTLLPLIASTLAALAITARADFTTGPEVKTTVSLQDDAGNPVQAAAVKVVYFGVGTPPEVFQEQSDPKGQAQAEAQLKGSIEIRVTKDGYYPVVWPKFRIKGLWDGEADARAEIIMRKIENPIALYARTVDLAVPVFDQWIGYDLQKGDWVKPWGNGVIEDLELFLNRKFIGFSDDVDERIDHLNKMHELNPSLKVNYIESVANFHEIDPSKLTFDEAKRHRMGSWTGELKIRVPTEGGGIHPEKKGYQVFTDESLTVSYARLRHWEMRMPHLAPEEDYQAEPLIWKKSYPSASPPEVDPKVGYFLRTRVKLDGKGKVISANYAKIMTSDAKYYGSDIQFDPRGKISFSYYFNPTVNDRNLEFDPEKNLFTDLEDKEKVRLP